MAFNITRMTLYALISALEEDLRRAVKDNIDAISFDENLLERAKFRIERDIGVVFGDLATSDYIDYFDMGDTYKIINSNSLKFPSHIASKIKSYTRKFERIIPVRNRVMHIRPLDYDDLALVTTICEEIANDDRVLWSNINETISHLKTDPSFVMQMEIKNYDDTNSINHNLPLPDFDETGLIGRNDEIEQIKKLCLGAFPVISIVGEGGIGKTALALKVAYELLEDEQSQFDAIVWVSSKTTQITVNEIKDIRGAITDSLGVIQEISEQITGDNNNDANLHEITEYLSTFKIALFIDNLETILDENIRSFVGALPQGSKIIITSRIGLGAYEYPIKLKSINESYASQLLRTLAKLRKVDSLAKLDEKVIRQYVNRMHRNPSYIKWFVSSIQTGLSPEVVLQNSDLFLEFCMSNVYEYLSKDAQQLTAAFQCSPGLKDIPELSFLTDFDSLRIQKSIQELMSTNMLTEASKTKGASVKTTYQLSELSRAYLQKHHKPTQTFQKRIREKRNKLNSIFEQQMSRRGQNKYATNNIKFRDKNDRVVVKMLHDAQKNIKNGEYDSAYETLQEAHRLSPDYFEVARVLAYFYQKNGNFNQAREQYELAIVLSPKTPQLHYWFGKYLLHEEENVDEAVAQFEIANTLDDGNPGIALPLARGYMFQHKFTAARDILDKLKAEISNADEHFYKMYLDTDIQIHYRTADDLTSEGNFSEALQSLIKMRDCFNKLENKYKDRHIRNKLKKCDYTLSRLSKHVNLKELNELKKWLELESTS